MRLFQLPNLKRVVVLKLYLLPRLLFTNFNYPNNRYTMLKKNHTLMEKEKEKLSVLPTGPLSEATTFI